MGIPFPKFPISGIMGRDEPAIALVRVSFMSASAVHEAGYFFSDR